MKTFCSALITAIVAAATPLSAQAQSYPDRPIRVIVPYGPGGTDVQMRLAAPFMAKLLGQSIVVENKAGGGATIGTTLVRNSPADGYTLLFTGTSALSVVPNMRTVQYKMDDFVPIGTLTGTSLIVVSRTDGPFKTLAELVAYAKANPGKLSFGSSGVGSPWLGMELLKTMAGISMVHVPYKGDAPAITDLMGGQIDLYATNVSALDAHHRSGKLRGIAVTSRKRASSLPDIATVDESGVPGYELESWFGFMVPAGTPRPIVDRLNAALVQIIGMPDVQKAMLDVGLTPATSTPEAYAARIRADVDKFTRIITASGIKID